MPPTIAPSVSRSPSCAVAVQTASSYESRWRAATHTQNGTVSRELTLQPVPSSSPAKRGSNSRPRRSARSRPSRVGPSGVKRATSASSDSRAIERELASAAAIATATAPAAPSGCAWVGAAERSASARTRARSPAKKAPIGAARMAAPLP